MKGELGDIAYRLVQISEEEIQKFVRLSERSQKTDRGKKYERLSESLLEAVTYIREVIDS